MVSRRKNDVERRKFYLNAPCQYQYSILLERHCEIVVRAKHVSQII